jgi:hypothetical protein
MRALPLVILLASSVASAEPAMRIGMTFGVDRNAPEAREFGPQFGAGFRAGRVVGELSYAYLSFFDPDTSIHRVGVSLRADVWRFQSGCTDRRCRVSKAIYGEVGTARRMGRWLVNEMPYVYQTAPQHELSLGVGYSLGNYLAPQDAGWQIGLRFSAARRDPLLGSACRGDGCMVAMPASTGLAESVMLEYMFMFSP